MVKLRLLYMVSMTLLIAMAGVILGGMVIDNLFMMFGGMVLFIALTLVTAAILRAAHRL